MALVYLDTKEVVWLEKVFYDAETQIMIAANQERFHGDFLYFIEERDGNLIFGSILASYGLNIEGEYSYPLKRGS